MGKLAFMSLLDDTGTIQVYRYVLLLDLVALQIYVEKSRLEEKKEGSFSFAKKMVDIGDFVGVVGGIKRTEKGELSVTADSITLLTKSIRPLPDKFHGLTDIEKRSNLLTRFLDLQTSISVQVSTEIRRSHHQSSRSGYL